MDGRHGRLDVLAAHRRQRPVAVVTDGADGPTLAREAHGHGSARAASARRDAHSAAACAQKFCFAVVDWEKQMI